MMETNVKLPMKVLEVNNTSSKLVLEINKDRFFSILQTIFGILLVIALVTAILFSYVDANPMLTPLLKVSGILFLIGIIAFFSKFK